ncbi:MAG: hypothetical protein EP326_11810 [Deltaproteobacteria bacterium]|nr:MAG: hypothetical protein EP326_11810 [Deltaproteobacteria bacterium]
MKYLTGIVVLILSFSVESKLIQIIHINDLHSYFTGHDDGRGGYAKVKTLIDQLKEKSRRDGIPSIVLDGGDFGEGTSFFMVDKGVSSFKSLNYLGVDVAVIGNHDHMLGVDILNEQIKKAGEGFYKPTQIVSANMVQFKGSNNMVKNQVFLDVEGTKISVIGLSTPEAHFQYTILPSFIAPPNKVAKEEVTYAKEMGADLVVALTHLGVKKDMKLAEKVEGLDVIIGGHSHDRLEQIVYQSNPKGRNIPIVQAGAHGLAVGSLILNVENGKVNVVKYKLHDVHKGIEEDHDVKQFVAEAIDKRDELFNGKWDEVVGESKIKLTGYENGNAVIKNSCWGKHMARISRKYTGSQVGIHLAFFQGVVKKPGKVTYGDLVDNYPHFSNYNEPGWKIASFNAKGSFLKVFIMAMINLKDQVGFDIDGVTWKTHTVPRWIPAIGGKKIPYKFKVGGNEMNKRARYSVAFPNEIGFVLQKMVGSFVQKIFPGFKSHNVYFWESMEAYVKQQSPIKCI